MIRSCLLKRPLTSWVQMFVSMPLLPNLRGSGSKVMNIDFKRTFKVRDNYYSFSKDVYLRLMDVSTDDSPLLKIIGPSKIVFERLSKGDSLETIREILSTSTNESPKNIDDFLIKFVTDLQEIGVLES